MATVKCQLAQRDGTIQQNLTSIKWAWFDQTDPQNFTAPTDTGTTEVTDIDEISKLHSQVLL